MANEAGTGVVDSGRRATTITLVLALVLAVLWFGGLGQRKLIKPDEGRYAEIPREMVATGDWLTPRLNGVKYFEKPPLQYWATALAYEAFGPSEWTSRLWTALTGFVGVLVVGFTAWKVWDRRTGLYASAIVASSVAYLLLAHFNALDMGLTFFLTTTLCATLLARAARSVDDGYDGDCCSPGGAPPAVAARRWMLVAWAALALAVLSKGPVALVLTGGALVAYVVISRDFVLLRSLDLVRGLALFALVAGPWFVSVSRANREFAHFFFIHEHVERFLTTEHRREGPIWYFVPVVLVGLLPWIGWAPRALVDGWKAPRRLGYSPERLLLAYAAVVFAFFSLSGSKLPSYVLPMFPPLAILVARRLATMETRALRVPLTGVAALAVVMAIAIRFVPLDSNDTAEAVASFRTGASLAMLAWFVGTIVAVVFAVRERRDAAVLAAAFAAVVGWSALLWSHESVGRGMSTADLATQMRPAIAPDTTIYSVGLFEHSLDFYLQRTVVPVAFLDELEFGLEQEPDKGIRTLPAFIDRWKAEPHPLAIMAGDTFATLTNAGVPMRVIARDRRRVVVGKPEGSRPPG